MAENLSIKKSPIDSILECPMCLHQLKVPQTLQQCLHSFCKSCLDKVPQLTQDGCKEWLCPMCDNFTEHDQIYENVFIEELQKILSDSDVCTKIKCEQCMDDCDEATWKCAECKIALCENGKALHFKIPMLKGHKILPLDDDGEKLIDNIVFCKVHEDIPALQNCRDCDELICYKCNATDHQGHIAETVEQALERILPESESIARQIDQNIDIIEAQIESVNIEFELTKESYAYCRMQMDDHLEKVICQMRAMKAQMEEDVNEQESIALDTLEELKQQLGKQLSETKIISNLTAVVTTKTRHTSQLQQLQTGLFEKVKSIGASKNEDVYIQLPETKFIEGHRNKEELENIFGSLRVDLEGNNISTSGEIWIDNDNFLFNDFEGLGNCNLTKSSVSLDFEANSTSTSSEIWIDNDNFLFNDFEVLGDCNFTKSLEVDTEMKWCNRVSHIDDKLWLTSADDSLLKIYNTEGELERTIDTGEHAMYVVKETYNGDLICGTVNGLYITNSDFAEWTMLVEGQFSDVVIHQNGFFALDYFSECIHQYSLTADDQWQGIFKHNLVADELQDFQLSSNSTLCVSDNHFWVTSDVDLQLYKFSDTGKYLQMWEKANVQDIDPIICGVDPNGKALIADYNGGNFYLLDTQQKYQIETKEIWQPFTVDEVRDAVFDSNNNLWVMSGNKNIKLTKYTQNNYQ